MRSLEGSLAEHRIGEIIREVFQQRGTGILEIDVDPETRRRLHFRDGELHLPTANPLAEQLAAAISNGFPKEEMRRIMRRIATVVGTWREGVFRFAADVEDGDEELLGPLPTAELVMAVATLGGGEKEFLDALGGEDARLVSCPDSRTLAVQIALDQEDLLLLSRLDEPRTVRSLLQEVKLDRKEALESLNRLQSIELIRPVVQEAEPEEELVSPKVLRRFFERVEEELRRNPVELAITAHRERLADLLGRIGRLNHYQLLEVERQAPTEAIHERFNDLSRLVHPSHAQRLGLGGREEALNLLFERATEAYLVLSDPQRRSEYDRDLADGGDEPSSGESPAKLARRYYLQAQDLVEEEEFHLALEMLQQAIQADAKAEYYVLRAEIQERNPQWLRRASDSYRQALQLDPENIELRLSLGRVYEEIGDLERARGVYRSAVVRDPEHGEAKAALRRLTGERAGRKGLFSRLFGKD